MANKSIAKNQEFKSVHEDPRYRCWAGMKDRCNNPNNKRYLNYGGRGIKVCERLNTFSNFREDMGERPSLKHSIDRIDVNGNYSCGHCQECLENGWIANCRWATHKQQGENKTNSHWVEVEGKRMSVTDASIYLKIHKDTIYRHIKKGLPINNQSLRKTTYVEYNGKLQSLTAWAKELSINRRTLSTKLEKGMAAEEAVKLSQDAANKSAKRKARLEFQSGA